MVCKEITEASPFKPAKVAVCLDRIKETPVPLSRLLHSFSRRILFSFYRNLLRARVMAILVQSSNKGLMRECFSIVGYFGACKV